MAFRVEISYVTIEISCRDFFCYYAFIIFEKNQKYQESNLIGNEKLFYLIQFRQIARNFL